jgi:hypothetical protein
VFCFGIKISPERIRISTLLNLCGTAFSRADAIPQAVCGKISFTFLTKGFMAVVNYSLSAGDPGFAVEIYPFCAF